MRARSIGRTALSTLTDLAFKVLRENPISIRCISWDGAVRLIPYHAYEVFVLALHTR